MLRVYLNGKLAREAPGDSKTMDIDTGDRGRFVCGVQIPDGHVVKLVSHVRGPRVLRVDVKTVDRGIDALNNYMHNRAKQLAHELAK